MLRKVALVGAMLFAALVLGLAGIIVWIRSDLQRSADNAVRDFPGDRVEALIRVVDCKTCSLKERNRAVWALGQMAEARASVPLKKHFDGQPCEHGTRLCQYELEKAITNIEKAGDRNAWGWRLLAGLHRPWR